MTRRRSLGFYAAHPRQFEADRAASDERELGRYEAEQDALEADRDRRETWQMRTDIPASALSKKQASQTPNEEAT